MNIAVFAHSEFRKVFELVNLPSEIFIYLFFGLIELFIIFMFPILEKSAFLVLYLLSCTVYYFSKVLNKLFIIA